MKILRLYLLYLALNNMQKLIIESNNFKKINLKKIKIKGSV